MHEPCQSFMAICAAYVLFVEYDYRNQWCRTFMPGHHYNAYHVDGRFVHLPHGGEHAISRIGEAWFRLSILMHEILKVMQWWLIVVMFWYVIISMRAVMRNFTAKRGEGMTRMTNVLAEVLSGIIDVWMPASNDHTIFVSMKSYFDLALRERWLNDSYSTSPSCVAKFPLSPWGQYIYRLWRDWEPYIISITDNINDEIIKIVLSGLNKNNHGNTIIFICS